MAKFKDFPPADALEVVKPDWESAPCNQTALSDPLTRANFDAMVDQFDTVDPYGRDFEIVRYPHWAAKWADFVFYRPGSKVADRARLIQNEMLKFPCVNIDLWESYEDEQTKAEKAQKGTK